MSDTTKRIIELLEDIAVTLVHIAEMIEKDVQSREFSSEAIAEHILGLDKDQERN